MLTRSPADPGWSASKRDLESRGALASLLPSDVIAVERLFHPPVAPLYPEESEFIAGAVTKRRREFATVRLCAREGLAQLGVEPAPILPGARGAPTWPSGIVGSMTHCDGYRAAAVARREAVMSVGIDAEPNLPLPEGVETMIAVAEERSSLARIVRSHPDTAWPRVLFSAKESVYKACFPITGRWLDFKDCVVTLDVNAETFTASLKAGEISVRGERIDQLEGRWRLRHHRDASYVLTAVVVP